MFGALADFALRKGSLLWHHLHDHQYTVVVVVTKPSNNFRLQEESSYDQICPEIQTILILMQ